MFPFFYPFYPFASVPYWYNYYYYYYNRPRMYRFDEEPQDDDFRNKEDDFNTENENVEIENADEEQRTFNIPGPPPGQFPGTFPSQAITPAEVLRFIEFSHPDILRTLISYGIPLTVARQLLRRVIRITLNQCRPFGY